MWCATHSSCAAFFCRCNVSTRRVVVGASPLSRRVIVGASPLSPFVLVETRRAGVIKGCENVKKNSKSDVKKQPPLVYVCSYGCMCCCLQPLARVQARKQAPRRSRGGYVVRLVAGWRVLFFGKHMSSLSKTWFCTMGRGKMPFGRPFCSSAPVPAPERTCQHSGLEGQYKGEGGANSPSEGNQEGRRRATGGA